MEWLKLLCPSFTTAEQQNLNANVQKINTAMEQRTEVRGKLDDIVVDVIIKLINKNIFKNISYIKILGIPDQTFLLSCSHFVKQNYNFCFYIKSLSFNRENFYFFITAETRIKVLFFPENYMIANLPPTCSEYIYDSYLTANFRGFFKNNYLEFPELREYNDRNYIPLIKGLILKKSVTKDCIILNLLDLRNFIDKFKLYINFKYVEEIQSFEREIQPNDIITVRDNIKKTVRKKLQIAFAMQYHRNAKFEVLRQTKFVFKNFKAKNRIEKNLKKIEFPLTELVNFQPHIFHRGLVRLIVRPLKIIYLQIRLFCRLCRGMASSCKCAQPQLDYIDFFAAMICQNSNLTFCTSIKGAENFNAFFEISAQELDVITNFLKTDGDIQYSFKKFVSFESKFAGVMSVFDKQLADKIIWGKACSKPYENENEGNVCVNFLKARNSFCYPNGLIRYNSKMNTMIYAFDIKIKHVEEDPAVVIKSKFQYLLSKLLI